MSSTFPQTEPQFKRLLDSVPVLSADWEDGRITYVNKKAADLLGYTREELLTLALSDIEEGFDLEKYRVLAQEVARTPETPPLETRFRSKNGDSIPVEWTLSLVELDGRPNLCGVGHDLRERKRVEEALKEADRRKDEFLAMLSHELRNPLAAIRNAIHLIDVQQLSDPLLVEACAILGRQSQLLAGLVDDLFDVFRITHHKIVLQLETLDLAQLVKLIVSDWNTTLKGRGLRLYITVPDCPVWVRADRMRLSQVLMNLLNNAAKFTDADGEITVTLTEDPACGQACLVVRDTGIGIAPDVLSHVFDTFCQGEPGLARTRGGLGLGLALVKGLVELHGGGVSAGSAGPGKGAEIGFWLPLTSTPKPDARPHLPAAGGRPLRILIIEDNRDTARTLAAILLRHGHQVHLAHSGTEGLARASEWQPEVVLCDLGLPGKDGYQVAEALRREPTTAHARLIAVSGYGLEEDRVRSKRAGFDLHFTKPIDPREILDLLAECGSQRGTSAPC